MNFMILLSIPSIIIEKSNSKAVASDCRQSTVHRAKKLYEGYFLLYSNHNAKSKGKMKAKVKELTSRHYVSDYENWKTSLKRFNSRMGELLQAGKHGKLSKRHR